MIKQIRHSFLTRYFWCFMSLYLLNCFVDSPDVQPDYFTEDLTYNDQESIIEIFVEKVLGFENAIAEYDDNDINQSSSLKSNFSIDFFVLPIITLSGNKNYMRLKKENLAVQNSILLTPYFKIHTPPPEA
ncbi:hypothetical protein QLS91_10800 [Flavobacterium sp. LB2P84]|jgi:hypothetical protein|uniref:Lipoprotein n=1 Tax=Flavobacterium yafengii TaxID=3041253 RepID=A0AAW6TPZ6_9FLAO|nr:hypothetical protein [Flavobacterium yafengii]MDI5897809.1 hypothetical protein [Flavobacterium yafengii]MDI5950536.1 hypothetical protein [Flavobacterium yafengii]MDI6033561.1 hypothetical protein [Flavobacterium yafengii]MDI6048027.1 hypothetical protein [Flavobacterium yafengii]